MVFLTPFLLYGLSLISVPIIIHLFQRKRVVEIPFATLKYLKVVAVKTARRSRIENLILLLLRCLTYALILLAAARPAMSPKTAAFLGGNVPSTTVIIIDNSMSMNYRAGEQTRLESAKRQAMYILDTLKPGDDVAVIAVNDKSQMLVAEPTVDHSVARNAVQGVQASSLRTDFSSALGAAKKIVAKTQKRDRRVYLLTDNQAGGWKFDATPIFDSVWKQTGAQLVIVRADELAPVNAAVTRVDFKNAAVIQGSTVRGVVTVQNFSAAPLHDLVEVKLGAQRVAQRAVDCAAESTADVIIEFQAPSLTGRAVDGLAALSGDNLPDDDRRYFWLPVQWASRALIVEGQQSNDERLSSGFFLRKALATGGDVTPKVISASELDEAALEGFTVIYLCDLARVTDRALVKLNRYLENGGTVAMFFGDQTDATNIGQTEFMPAKPTSLRELPTGRLVVRALDPKHPLFQNAWDNNVPFPALPQRKAFDWKTNPGARVLLTLGDNNTPFLILGEKGRGRVLLINASADRSWGDLPLSPAFLPLVKQISRWSAEQSAAPQTQFTVGDPLPVPPNVPKGQPMSLKLPNGQQQNVVLGDTPMILERADLPGIYEVSTTAEGVIQRYAVNTDPGESDLRPMVTDELKKIVPHQSVIGQDALQRWIEDSKGLVPLWPWFLLLALIVFGIEAFASNFAARKRSQSEETHIKTGRLTKRRRGGESAPVGAVAGANE